MLSHVYTVLHLKKTFHMQLQLLPQLFHQVLTIFKLRLNGKLAR